MSALNFGTTLRTVYAAIAGMANAIGSFAKAAENIGSWADETTATWSDEARIERAKRVAELERELAVETAKPLTITE